MTLLDQLASSLGRRDEVPNQKLAKVLEKRMDDVPGSGLARIRKVIKQVSSL